MKQEFPGRFPTEIVAEMRRLPVGFLNEVIEAGAYGDTKLRLDANQKDYTHPLVELVQEIESELALKEIEARRRASGE